MSLSPPSGEKIKAAVEVKNNESPTVQPGQHWRSCDLTGSLPPQWPRSPAMCAQQLIRCRGGCGTSARIGRVTAKIDDTTIKTKQRDNPVITRSKLTLCEDVGQPSAVIDRRYSREIGRRLGGRRPQSR